MCSQNPQILTIEIVAGIVLIFSPILTTHSYATDDGICLTRRSADENPDFLPVQCRSNPLIYFFFMFLCEFEPPGLPLSRLGLAFIFGE